MTNLPNDDDLPIAQLAACFNDTSASYKYYWLLSLLQAVENGERKISKKCLFARMVSNAWYTVNYFRVSFGKQDKLQNAIQSIKDFELLRIDENRDTVFKRLTSSKNEGTHAQLQTFNKQVPHWFLSPWFPKCQRETDWQREKRIYAASKRFTSQCVYALYDDSIIINPAWEKYLTTNSRVLKDFCHWNLALYLQAKNPNVPDIPNKIIKPAYRNNLTRQRKNFWDLVIAENGYVKCIYTGKKLTVGAYAVEHFIPYSFVSHDLIWNLIPADRSFNCSKNNRLPSIEKHFDLFFDLQKTAIDIIRNKYSRNTYLDDYLTIFPDLHEISNLGQAFVRDKFKETIQPLITIAANNGFELLA